MSDQQTDSCVQSNATSEHHKALNPFVGTFNATVKLWMGPGDPQVMKGVMQSEWDLGDRFIKHTFTGQDGGPFGTFEGRGYWGYNTTTNLYEGFWIDTASTVMQTETGTVDASGKVWTMTGEMTDPCSGNPMTKKSTITLTDFDHHLMEMYFVGPDGNEFKGMEISYVRA